MDCRCLDGARLPNVPVGSRRLCWAGRVGSPHNPHCSESMVRVLVSSGSGAPPEIRFKGRSWGFGERALPKCLDQRDR
eukprot:8990106-Heterocapsa_arctica.AAC.1